jgi:hypothetical protein
MRKVTKSLTILALTNILVLPAMAGRAQNMDSVAVDHVQFTEGARFILERNFETVANSSRKSQTLLEEDGLTVTTFTARPKTKTFGKPNGMKKELDGDEAQNNSSNEISIENAKLILVYDMTENKRHRLFFTFSVKNTGQGCLPGYKQAPGITVRALGPNRVSRGEVKLQFDTPFWASLFRSIGPHGNSQAHCEELTRYKIFENPNSDSEVEMREELSPQLVQLLIRATHIEIDFGGGQLTMACANQSDSGRRNEFWNILRESLNQSQVIDSQRHGITDRDYGLPSVRTDERLAEWQARRYNRCIRNARQQ